MKAAFAVWNGRIAPVFDVSRHLHVVRVESGHIVSETEEDLPADGGADKVLSLTLLGVDTLVCGAVSGPLQNLIASQGIRVIPFVAGDLPEVIQAWLSDDLESGEFAMPGCQRRQRRRRRGDGGLRSRGRRGEGGGRGHGRRGDGSPKGSWDGHTRDGTECACVECGHTEVHERGEPCARRRCPRCGARMRRQHGSTTKE